MFNTDLTYIETEVLIDRVKKCGEKASYIEIGVFEGGTLKKVLERTQATCEGIDLFEDFVVNDKNTHVTGTITQASLQEALEKLFPRNRFNLQKADSQEMLKIYSKIAEITKNKIKNCVVFVDGNHKYQACLDDCLESLKFMENGYLLLHNASNSWEPDTWYIKDDGGPYAVTQYLITQGLYYNLRYEGTFDRLAVFKVCNGI